MNFTILMGSPRLRENTAELCKPFMRTLEEAGASLRYLTVADKHIAPCKGCYCCQDVSDSYGCVINDDMHGIVEDVVWCDCLVLATPIYTWFCPAQMKAVLDRFYGMNKYYGSASGSLWSGRDVALILTHGYDADYGATPFAQGIQRLCEHYKLRYRGMFSVRDDNNMGSFRTPEAIKGADAFAKKLLSEVGKP